MLRAKAKNIVPTAITSNTRVHPVFEFIVFLLVLAFSAM
jgi:hypothetical protein